MCVEWERSSFSEAPDSVCVRWCGLGNWTRVQEIPSSRVKYIDTGNSGTSRQGVYYLDNALYELGVFTFNGVN